MDRSLKLEGCKNMVHEKLEKLFLRNEVEKPEIDEIKAGKKQTNFQNQ